MTNWTKKQQKKHRKLWIEALRSGLYEQGTGFLRDINDNYCCLGVACEVAIKNGLQLEVVNNSKQYSYYNYTEYTPQVVMDYFGLTTKSGKYVQVNHEKHDSLAENNDMDNMSFAEIADIIENEPEGLFK